MAIENYNIINQIDNLQSAFPGTFVIQHCTKSNVNAEILSSNSMVVCW